MHALMMPATPFGKSRHGDSLVSGSVRWEQIRGSSPKNHASALFQHLVNILKILLTDVELVSCLPEIDNFVNRTGRCNHPGFHLPVVVHCVQNHFSGLYAQGNIVRDHGKCPEIQLGIDQDFNTDNYRLFIFSGKRYPRIAAFCC